jgi:hypothetical protein
MCERTNSILRTEPQRSDTYFMRVAGEDWSVILLLLPKCSDGRVFFESLTGGEVACQLKREQKCLLGWC